MDSDRAEKRGITRRGVLAGAAAIGIGAGLDRLLVGGGDERAETAAPVGSQEPPPFYGARQAGIATPAPEFLSFAAFDLTSGSADDLRDLLQEWTSAAASLTQGKPYRPKTTTPNLPPSDTGEAIGLGPRRLTVTFGFGPSLFARGKPGLRSRRPAALAELPPFEGDSLDPQRSGGDLCVQTCAEDPQVAFHAIHVLTRIATGSASLRWLQEGFGRTSSTSRSQPTPRNLMGFKDGTNNIRGEDTEAMDEQVWVQPGDGPTWMEGGTYLVARRIKMLLDVWDETSLEGQERAIGREKVSGAPLGSTNEHDRVDLDAREAGQLVVPADAHIRLSSPEANRGTRILRRGYSFSEPLEPGSGQIDAGLFFISFQRDPEQFVLIQRRLAASDALNRHILHTGSAVFACPPGTRRGGFIGEGLFA
jgi:deferrochelatase/peroxidase EfeB